MLTILHGENIVQSRKKLGDLIQKSKENKTDVKRLHAKDLTISLLEETVGSTSLFGNQHVVIIEELHSLPASKKRTALIEKIANFSIHNDIILWEKKKITKPQQNKFLKLNRESGIQEFKITNYLFSFLDLISPNLNKKKLLLALQSAVESDGEWMVFTMIAWKLRQLIKAKDGGILKGAPFMISKLKKQSSAFSMTELMNLHAKLLRIDIAHKTSTNKLELGQDLDLLFINM